MLLVMMIWTRAGGTGCGSTQHCNYNVSVLTVRLCMRACVRAERMHSTTALRLHFLFLVLVPCGTWSWLCQLSNARGTVGWLTLLGVGFFLQTSSFIPVLQLHLSFFTMRQIHHSSCYMSRWSFAANSNLGKTFCQRSVLSPVNHIHQLRVYVSTACARAWHGTPCSYLCVSLKRRVKLLSSDV